MIFLCALQEFIICKNCLSNPKHYLAMTPLCISTKALFHQHRAAETVYPSQKVIVETITKCIEVKKRYLKARN